MQKTRTLWLENWPRYAHFLKSRLSTFCWELGRDLARLAYLLHWIHQIEHYAKNQDSLVWKLTEICSFLEIPFIHVLQRTGTRFRENSIFTAQNSPHRTLCKTPGLSSLKIDRDMHISWNLVYPRFAENWDEIWRDLHICCTEFTK
jgi:hypothetical protein